MRLVETKLKGVYVVELELFEDERGFFARTFCQKEFKTYGLNPNLAQISIAYNKKKGTIRGMHYQLPPHEEAKLVRVSRGAIYDVVLDLRKDSKTFKEWISIELTGKNNKMIYVPPGCAHGYQTLEDNTEVIYHISEFHVPELYRGVRWDDPTIKIKWPEVEKRIISEKDRNYPNAPQS